MSTSVALAMIVRNEAKVIERCLASVRPYISHAVISDTGSHDQTTTKVKDYFEAENLPCHIWRDPWIDFGHNRNLNLHHAQGLSDWVLTIDADEVLEGPPGPLTIPTPPLPLSPEVDAYECQGITSDASYQLLRIFKNNGNFSYQGKTHEVLVPKTEAVLGRLPGYTWRHIGDGHRREEGRKFIEDAALLAAEVAQDPTNTRAGFYLAQSYQNLGAFDLAAEHYKKRLALGGWIEELYWAQYQIGIIERDRAKSIWPAAESLMRAIRIMPERYEAVVDLMAGLNQERAWATAYHVSHARTGYNNAQLFINADGPWRFLEEQALSLYYLGHRADSKVTFIRILQEFPLSPVDEERIRKSLSFFE